MVLQPSSSAPASQVTVDKEPALSDDDFHLPYRMVGRSTQNTDAAVDLARVSKASTLLTLALVFSAKDASPVM